MSDNSLCSMGYDTDCSKLMVYYKTNYKKLRWRLHNNFDGYPICLFISSYDLHNGPQFDSRHNSESGAEFQKFTRPQVTNSLSHGAKIECLGYSHWLFQAKVIALLLTNALFYCIF